MNFLRFSVLAISLLSVADVDVFADDVSEAATQPPQARRVRRTAEEILASPEFQNFERLQRSGSGSGRQTIGSGSGKTRLRMRTGSGGGSSSESRAGSQNSNGRQRLPGPGQNAGNGPGNDGQPGENMGGENRPGNDPFGGNNENGPRSGEPGNNIGENLGGKDFPEIEDVPNPADNNFGQDGPGNNADGNRAGNDGNPGNNEDGQRPGDNIGDEVGPNGEPNNNQNPNGMQNGGGDQNQNPNGDNAAGNDDGAGNNNPNPPRNNEPLPPVRQNGQPDENPPRKQFDEPTDTEDDFATQSPASSSFAGFIAGLFHLLAYAILGVVIGLILWLIIKAIKEFEMPTRLERENDPGGDLPSNANEPENAPGEHPPDVYIAKARELAATGNYREAIAQLAMGAMSRIERTNRIRYRRGLTIRDYLRALRQNKHEYQAFRSIVRVFEPISFGRREPTRALFEQTLGGYEAGFAGGGESGG